MGRGMCPCRLTFTVQTEPATSRGDAALNVTDATNPDRWVTLNTGTDVDPFQRGTWPQVGFAFDGAGGARRASMLDFTPGSYPNSPIFNYGWTGVTVAPGQTVAFMHFAVQQYLEPDGTGTIGTGGLPDSDFSSAAHLVNTC